MVWQIILLLFLVIISNAAPQSDERMTNENNLYIFNFPLPLRPGSDKRDMCGENNLRKFAITSSRTSLQRRMLAILEYEAARRLCCSHEVPVHVLRSCIESHRRDVINSYCTSELAVDSPESRAHPCCFSMSAQRYICFERYHHDVINVDGLSEMPDLANHTELFSELSRKKLARDFFVWMQNKLFVVCDVMSIEDSTANVLRLNRISMLDSLGHNKEYISILSQYNQLGVYHDESARLKLIGDAYDKTCCLARGLERMKCFMKRKSQLYDDFCLEKSNYCCDLLGRDRYNCLDELSENENDEASKSADEEPSSSSIVGDDVEGESENRTKSGTDLDAHTSNETINGNFTISLLRNISRMNHIPFGNTDQLSRENLTRGPDSSKVLSEKIKFFNRNTSTSSSANETNIAPLPDLLFENNNNHFNLSTNATDISVSKNSSAIPVFSGNQNISESLVETESETIKYRESYLNQSSMPVSRNNSVRSLNDVIIQHFVNESATSSNTSTPTTMAWSDVPKQNRENFKTYCCRVGHRIGSTKKWRKCPVKIMKVILKRNKTLPQKFSSIEAKRSCGFSFRACCLKSLKNSSTTQ